MAKIKSTITENKVVDTYKEHFLHKNRVKGISGKTCSECWKEHQNITSKSSHLSESIIERAEAQIEDFLKLNGHLGHI